MQQQLQSTQNENVSTTTGSNYFGSVSGRDPVTMYNLTSPIVTSTVTSRPAGSSTGDDWTPYLWLYVSPVLLAIGIVGNSLTLWTMTRRPMTGTTTYIYLVSMAIVDNFLLVVSLIPDWLEGAEIIVIKELDEAICKLQKFLSFACADTAVWIRTVFTIDRAVAISQPLYTGHCWGHVTSARLYVLTSLAASFVKDFHEFFTRGAQYSKKVYLLYNSTDNSSYVIGNVTALVLVSNCGYPTAEYQYFEKFIRPWIAFVLFSAGPFIILTVCNSVIVYSLVQRRVSNHRQRLTSSGQKAKHATEQLVQVTAMCLAASVSFVVCTTPSIVLLVGKEYWQTTRAYQVAKAVNNQLFFVIFSANFFLYCLTAQKFRSTLMTSLSCRRLDNGCGLARLGALRSRDGDTPSTVTSQTNVCTLSAACIEPSTYSST